jgi:hypothetical protein
MTCSNKRETKNLLIRRASQTFDQTPLFEKWLKIYENAFSKIFLYIFKPKLHGSLSTLKIIVSKGTDV